MRRARAARHRPSAGWGSVNLAELAAAAVLLEPKAAKVGLSLPRHQNPVAAHQIRATVRCSERCLMAAFAEVSINHGRPFTVKSKVYRLTKADHKTIAMMFSGRQLGKLRAALRNHRSIQAHVYGVTVSPAPRHPARDQRNAAEDWRLSGSAASGACCSRVRRIRRPLGRPQRRTT